MEILLVCTVLTTPKLTLDWGNFYILVFKFLGPGEEAVFKYKILDRVGSLNVTSEVDGRKHAVRNMGRFCIVLWSTHSGLSFRGLSLSSAQGFQGMC